MSNRATVEMRFEDGSTLSHWLKLEHTEQFSNPVDTLDFVCAPPRDQVEEYRNRLAPNSIVSFRVNGYPQAACYIVRCEQVSDPDSGTIFSVSAKSVINLLYESTVPYETEVKALAADKPILDLVASICEPFGLGEVFAEKDDAVIKSKTGKAPAGIKATAANLVKYKNAVPQPNETCYAFLNRILSRLGLILRCGAVGGELYLTRPHYEQQWLYAFKQGPDGPAGWETFEGAVRVTRDSSNQYSFVECTGVSDDSKAATSADRPKFKAESAAINGARPPFKAGKYITHKPCYYRDTSCQTKQQAKGTALLVMGERAEQAFGVEGTVANIVSVDGVPFTVDTIAHIYLPLHGIDEEMWLASRTISVDADGGASTRLRFIPKGYYAIGELPS
jgi:prophage tail gpP-like protein